MNKLLLILVSSLLLSGCMNASGARMGLFTATSPVAVTIKGDVFAGWAVGDISGRGTIEIQSHINPEISCVGEFRYISTWTKTGIGTMTCNDGGKASFNFKGLTNLRLWLWHKQQRTSNFHLWNDTKRSFKVFNETFSRTGEDL